MATPVPTIRVAAEHQRHAALELALRPLPPDARGPLLDGLAAAGDHPLGPLDALLVAVNGGRVVAATWAQPSPGKAAALWPPEWDGARPADGEATERRLLLAATAACDAAHVPMTQSLFETADDPRLPALVGAGFRPIATLDYLGRSIRSANEAAKDDPELTFDPFTQRDHGRLKRLLRRTYVDSLDCPGIEDLRDLDDVLAGYRATGRYDPQHWLFVRSEDQDVGVLLLAEHPDADQAELVYMGLAPEARGRGYGEAIVRRAIAIAGRMGVDQLMVAVDQNNAPARRVYERAGFAVWAHRLVYIRQQDATV